MNKKNYDTHTPEQRRKNMQRIKSENTIPEKCIMKALKRKGVYFTKHRKDVYGKPDIVFKRKKIAVFIDSDFWHCNPDYFTPPKNNSEYWEKKIERNKSRDKEVNNYLRENGWTVLRFWERDIKENTEIIINKILDAIKQG